MAVVQQGLSASLRRLVSCSGWMAARHLSRNDMPSTAQADSWLSSFLLLAGLAMQLGSHVCRDTTPDQYKGFL